jgi:predicted flavoprotein YhiN
LSFPDAVLGYTFLDQEGIRKEARGPVLLTHFGISGPATFIFAAYTAFERVDKEYAIIPLFHPIADMRMEDWSKFLLDAVARSPKKQLSTILAESSLPKRFATAFVQRYSKDIPIGQVTKDERQTIARLL